MCLAIPGKIVELKDNHHALIDFGGINKEINSFLVKDLEIGDIVMVHAGFIIEKLK